MLLKTTKAYAEAIKWRIMTDPTSKASYMGSGLATAIGAITISQWTAIIGIVLAIGTFLFNIWYKRKMLQYTKDHNEEMEKIERGKNEAEGRSNDQNR